METEASELLGIEIYTAGGKRLGSVDNLLFDMEKQTLYGLYVSRPNPLLVENSISVCVPLRWVQDVGDIVLLNYFPRFVKTGRTRPEETPLELLEESAQKVRSKIKGVGEKITEGKERIVEGVRSVEDKIVSTERKAVDSLRNLESEIVEAGQSARERVRKAEEDLFG